MILLNDVLDYLNPEMRARQLAERVLQPLFDCSTEELLWFAECLEQAAGVANARKSGITKGIATMHVLNNLAQLAHTVHTVK